MARPRKPTAVKAMQGTLQRCRTNFCEPVPSTMLDQVDPPSFLGDKAMDLWRYAVAQAPREMLTSLDMSVLATWADTQAKIIECEEEILAYGMFVEDEKTGRRMANKALAQQNELKGILLRCLSELGFTPASRSKVSVAKKGDTEANPFMDL